jgi:hypothetical protein
MGQRHQVVGVSSYICRNKDISNISKETIPFMALFSAKRMELYCDHISAHIKHPTLSSEDVILRNISVITTSYSVYSIQQEIWMYYRQLLTKTFISLLENY